MLPVSALPLIGWSLLIRSTVGLVIFHRKRFLALVLLGVVGLFVSMGFVYFSAPDLALTQISVEVVTIILLLLALNFLPRETPTESSPTRRLRDAGIAIVGGVALALMETLNDFGAVQFFGVDTFTTGIYRTWFGMGEA
uniref:hydrogenase subunit MbhD domain-containing protein n=1 Tax=Nocardia farcinica TaxID=37329 RepID=UPI001E552102